MRTDTIPPQQTPCSALKACLQACSFGRIFLRGEGFLFEAKKENHMCLSKEHKLTFVGGVFFFVASAARAAVNRMATKKMVFIALSVKRGVRRVVGLQIMTANTCREMPYPMKFCLIAFLFFLLAIGAPAPTTPAVNVHSLESITFRANERTVVHRTGETPRPRLTYQIVHPEASLYAPTLVCCIIC